MQSPEGMKILKLLLDEVCETFDVPYLHIGTDAVSYTHLDVYKRQLHILILEQLSPLATVGNTVP